MKQYLRAIIAYCKEKGIDTAELTDEELKQFDRKKEHQSIGPDR